MSAAMRAPCRPRRQLLWMPALNPICVFKRPLFFILADGRRVIVKPSTQIVVLGVCRYRQPGRRNSGRPGCAMCRLRNRRNTIGLTSYFGDAKVRDGGTCGTSQRTTRSPPCVKLFR